jgi:hypothetical protein
MTDDELLQVVAEERQKSVGFDHDEELRDARDKALNYSKGVMPDLPAMEGRSSAVSTDVADAIETIMPDLVEIFTGEDVATFTPVGPEDEDAARQETDYVNHVVFEENDGFLLLMGFIKDALQSKIGVCKAWWEEYEEPAEEFTGKSLEEAISAKAQYGDALIDAVQNEDGTVDFKIAPRKNGRVCTELVAPEDFTVSRDTVKLGKTPYCAHKSRPRAYELLERGLSADVVSKLPAYGVEDDETDLARDTAGESDEVNSSQGDFRQVEIVEHYLRIKGGYWRVLTDATDSMVLEKEKVRAVRFYAITPFPVTHRFYGLSVADKLLEIQRIKTALLRMLLDSGYFALNQRMAVSEAESNEHTLNDLIVNEPNRPVRMARAGAVTPLGSGGLSFDAFGALEYMAVESEKRTGIVRNAQGLNPDTLHDTAKGAMALMAQAAKRTRFIARIFAETGIKDLFLGVHGLLRENATAPAKARLRNKWVDVDFTKWGNRSDMTIEIGVGSGGQEQQLAALTQALEVMQGVVMQQGGLNGPLVTADNVYALLKKYFEQGLKFKTAAPFIMDPAEAEPQEPQPDPAMLEAQAKQQEMQAKLQLEQAKIDGQREIAQIKAQSEIETVRAVATEKATLARQEAEERAALKRQEHAENMALMMERNAAEIEHKRQVAQVELSIKREEMEIEKLLKMEAIRHKSDASTNVSGPELGGDPG